MPTVAELTKFIKSHKAQNCPRHSGLPKAKLLKVANGLGYKPPAVKKKNIQAERKKAVLNQLNQRARKSKIIKKYNTRKSKKLPKLELI